MKKIACPHNNVLPSEASDVFTKFMKFSKILLPNYVEHIKKRRKTIEATHRQIITRSQLFMTEYVEGGLIKGTQASKSLKT